MLFHKKIFYWFFPATFAMVLFYFSFYETIVNAVTEYTCKNGEVVDDLNLCIYSDDPIDPAPQILNDLTDGVSNLSVGVFNGLNPTDYEYCVFIPINLAFRSKGRDVTALQNYLFDRGFMEVEATGHYGRATELAIQKFQHKNEIDITGIAGPITRNTIKDLTCSERTYTKTVTVKKKTSPTFRIYKDIDFTIQENIATLPIVKSTNNKVQAVLPTTNNKNNNKDSTTDSQYSKITTLPLNDDEAPIKPVEASLSIPKNNNLKLSSSSGKLSSENKNNLYFIYKSSANEPGICITLNNIDCNDINNYKQIVDGDTNPLFESSNLSGQWLLTLYYSSGWGVIGDIVKVYIKDSPEDVVSIYTVTIN